MALDSQSLAGRARTAIRRLHERMRLVRAYWAESRTLRDFVAVMRVRLSQSKVGGVVARRSLVVDVDLVNLGPAVRLRSHTTDISVMEELIQGDNYAHLPAEDGEPVRTVVDLGSNIGLTFRWLHQRYPDARFACVEPEPGNLAVLRANVDAVAPETLVVGACIGGSERHGVRLTTDHGDFAWHMAGDDGQESSGPTVDVVTMDDLLARAGMDRIDVLKCDVEGAEAELFADCRSWIGGVRALAVECHGDFTTARLLEALAANGARFELLHLERNPAFSCETATLVAAKPER